MMCERVDDDYRSLLTELIAATRNAVLENREFLEDWYKAQKERASAEEERGERTERCDLERWTRFPF
jgi:hypothetical protein